MAGSSPQNEHYDDGEDAHSTPQLSNRAFTTRTVAIIKSHALSHRFEIERRIQEASFEIVKERPMEFDTETDPETLYELFGEDAESLGEGPVWVYILERRRAVEVWHTLMGDRDPDVARNDSPHALRALYGLSLDQNGLMGSPDTQTAEIQIASLFASSPPFPSSDLPPVGHDHYDTVRSISPSILEDLRNSNDEGYAASSPSTAGGTKNGKPVFKARPVPKTQLAPDIAPRTTKAAALRAGIQVESVSKGPRRVATKESLAKTFANVPGHKRTETIQVASTAAPTIAPRMTRAASLRLGQDAAPVKKSRPSSVGNAFEGVPGHKRRETISVASVAAPTVAPRVNRSAMLRLQKDVAPPSSFMFRTPSAPKVQGLSRSTSQSSLNVPKSTTSRPSSAASMRANSTPAASISRPPPSSYASTSSRTTNSTNSVGNTNGVAKKVEQASAPAPPISKPKPRPSSLQAPTIAPRPNRSALLRASKPDTSGPGKTSGIKTKITPRAIFA